jgi:hypothetical protein
MIKAKKDCHFEYTLSYKPVSRGSPEKQYIGTLKCLGHTHRINLNPFSFKVHETATVEYQGLIQQARKYRMGKLSYSEGQQLLEQEKLGMTLSHKTYYNLLRKKLCDHSNPDTITGLLEVLQEADFVCRTRTDDELDADDNIISRKLVQIVFLHREAIRFGQRYISGKVLIVDGTCNTNEKRMPLLVGVGITNSGKTFPLALSYCPGETAESYDFFFWSLREEVWVDGALEPAVLMGDQAAGLIKAIDVLHSAPKSKLQFCNWHAVEAMRAKFNKAGYTSEEIDGWVDGEVEVKGLTDHSWDYIESATEDELETNRTKLINALRPKERGYITDTWLPKEHRVIFCYTKLLPNLGCVATQRSETYHRPLKKVTNGQLSLEDSASAISTKILSILKDLSMDEDRALIDTDLALDMNAFRDLVNVVSIDAIRRIEKEWLLLHELTHEAGTTDIDLGPCECELLLRFSLPCKHHLLQACQSGTPLPKSLVHPRWWLKGPTIRSDAWRPSYAQEQQLVLSPKRKDIYKAIQDVMLVRDRLGPEEQSRFDSQYLRAQEKAKAIAERHEDLSRIPIGMPDAVPKKTWRKKKDRGKANAPGLTAAEASDKDRKERERLARRAGKARATSEELAEEGDDDGIYTRDSPTPRVGESQGGTTITVAPKATMRPPPPPARSPSLSPVPADLPLSTAPSRLPEAGQKRKRSATNKYTEGRQAGILRSQGHSQQ